MICIVHSHCLNTSRQKIANEEKRTKKKPLQLYFLRYLGERCAVPDIFFFSKKGFIAFCLGRCRMHGVFIDLNWVPIVCLDKGLYVCLLCCLSGDRSGVGWSDIVALGIFMILMVYEVKLLFYSLATKFYLILFN